MAIGQYFEMGGWMMYVLLGLGLLALPAAFALPYVSFVSPKPRRAMIFAVLLAALGLLAAGLGALGQAQALRRVEAAVGFASPEQRVPLRLAGSSESRVSLIFGLLVAALPLAGACIALGPARSEKLDRPAIARAFSLAAGVAVIVLGLAGQQAALFSAERAQVFADPETRAALAADSYRSASVRLKLAAALGVPLVLIGAGFFGGGTKGEGKAKPSG
jgi:hypothetical protein